jgi:hypothetical protein
MGVKKMSESKKDLSMDDLENVTGGQELSCNR